MPINGPGSPGFVPATTDVASETSQGDVQRLPGAAAGYLVHVNSNNTASSFISANVPCAGSVQTVITSLTLQPGVWDLSANVSASVNAAVAGGVQEVALIPSGGAASTAYASTGLAPTLHQTEAAATLTTSVNLATATTVQLVGFAQGAGGNGSNWTALATTPGNSYANATGIVAVPSV